VTGQYRQTHRVCCETGEEGFTLIELLVASSIALVVLGVLVALVTLVLKQANVYDAQYANQRTALVALNGVMQDLGNARPLGYCEDDTTSTAAPTPYQACRTVGTQGSSLDVAAQNGMCFYAYPTTQTTATPTTPPDLECLVIDTSTGHLYRDIYPPNPGPSVTYTSCSFQWSGDTKGSCWSDSGAPPEGSLPPTSAPCSPGASGASGCQGEIVGTLNDPTTAFCYLTASSGGGTNPSPCSTNVAAGGLSTIEAVQFSGGVQSPSVQGTQTYNVSYFTPLWGSKYQNEGTWDGL
jgi:type II secretory pathway pseudopilin PulG